MPGRPAYLPERPQASPTSSVHIRNILRRVTIRSKNTKYCCLQEDAEQLIEFESDAAVNTAGDAHLQHEEKSTFDILNEHNFLTSRLRNQNQVGLTNINFTGSC